MRVSRLSWQAGLLLPCLLSGCASFYDEIFLHADGSGSYHLVVYVKKVAVDEDVKALEKAVGDRAAGIAREAGFSLRSVGVRREGPLLQIDVTADFHDLSAFASPALGVSDDRSRWSFVVPREMSFKGGRFAARVLRDSAPPAGDPLRGGFKGREGRFTVHFPDEVRETNGEARERLANWSFALERLSDGPVEMTAVTRDDVPFGTALLGALLLLGLGVFLAWVVRRRTSPGGSGASR